MGAVVAAVVSEPIRGILLRMQKTLVRDILSSYGKSRPNMHTARYGTEHKFSAQMAILRSPWRSA
jgi:hypothetical protein